MKTSAYWKKRVELLEEANHNNATKYANEISNIYDSATRELEGQLTKWYTRYANEEGITLAEAKRLLNTRELEEFRMDVHEYIKKGRSLDPQWAKQLEGASVRVHISRLEALKVQTQQLAERTKGYVADTFDEFAVKTYSDQYYKTIFEIQKGAGIGFDITKLDEKQVRKVINKPWAVDGKNFSQRIWGDRTKLVNELHQTLSKGIIQGKAPQKMVKELSERMGVSKSATARLVYTESSFFANQATLDSYKELGVGRYEVLATLDKRTTPICQKMDGKTFNVKEMEVGVNYPPFHVYCRTTTVPFFDDEFDIKEERAARDEEGKYYTVPSSMKYPEWFKTFVEGGSKTGLVEVAKDVAQLAINEASDLFQMYGDENYRMMHDALIKNGDEDLIKVWSQNEAKLAIDDTTYTGGAHFHSHWGVKLNLNEDKLGNSWSKPFQTSFHELGHNIDFLLGGGDHLKYYSTSYKDGLFAKTIREEVEKRIKDFELKLKAEFKRKTLEENKKWLVDHGMIHSWQSFDGKFKKVYVYKAFEQELTRISAIKRSALSDIVEGVTKAKVRAGFGHGASYWSKRPQGVEREAFAEFWESVVNPEQWEVLKEYLPESTKIFKQMLKDAIK